MAQGRNRLLATLALSLCLPVVSQASSVEQEVKPSDKTNDLPSPYRYSMNGSQLVSQTDAIDLAPLTESLWNYAPQQFSNWHFNGQLRTLGNSSAAKDVPGPTIPYISCDEDDAFDQVGHVLNATDDDDIRLAIFYSETRDHCVISDQLVSAGGLDIFTVVGIQNAQPGPELDLDPNSTATVQILPDLNSLPSRTDSDNQPKRSNSPIPMIVLYSLTSLITMLLLFVIIGGAIKARRHPERYGPRAVLRPRQSRAKGIAMAMLETLPIVKFGDPDLKQQHSSLEEGNVELNDTTKTPVVAVQGESPRASPGDEAPHHLPVVPVDGSPATAQQNVDAGATSVNSSGNTSADHEPPRSTPERSLPDHADDSLSCSICTEDFTVGEEVRVLPCDHKFHPICVDPWLLNVSGTCPLCRIDLRPPQEALEADDIPSPAQGRGFLSVSARPRSTVGSIMRGTRGLDLQALGSASREERIGTLRRWRNESRQRESTVQDGTSESIDARPRSTRISQWLRDGFAVRPSPERHPAQNTVGTGLSSRAARPRTWFGHDESAAAATERAIQSPAARNDPVAREERANTWYGDMSTTQGANRSQSRSSDVGPRPTIER